MDYDTSLLEVLQDYRGEESLEVERQLPLGNLVYDQRLDRTQPKQTGFMYLPPAVNQQVR